MLYVMRDPVNRLWSHIAMDAARWRYLGQTGMSEDKLLKAVLANEYPYILSRSNYSGTLFALDHLSPDRVQHLFYETMFNDCAMRSLCDFLHVGFHSGNYTRQVRVGSYVRMTWEQREILRWLMAPTYRIVHAKFGDLVPKGWDMSAMDAKRPAFLDKADIHADVVRKIG